MTRDLSVLTVSLDLEPLANYKVILSRCILAVISLKLSQTEQLRSVDINCVDRIAVVILSTNKWIYKYTRSRPSWDVQQCWIYVSILSSGAIRKCLISDYWFKPWQSMCVRYVPLLLVQTAKVSKTLYIVIIQSLVTP